MPASGNISSSSSRRDCVMWLKKMLTSTSAGAYLVDKYGKYRRDKFEADQRNVTERELRQLNRKIDKLLTRLGDSEIQSEETRSSDEDECVVCLSAGAVMQTHPCGHRVTCRRCFIRTIQSAIRQRSLPLRCVVCRSRIVKVSEEEPTAATPQRRSSPAAAAAATSPSSGQLQAPPRRTAAEEGVSGGRLFARRFLAGGGGRSNPDLGSAAGQEGLFGGSGAARGLLNPVLVERQQQQQQRKQQSVGHDGKRANRCRNQKNKPPLAGEATDQRSRSFRDSIPVIPLENNNSSKPIKWKPFVKQISV